MHIPYYYQIIDHGCRSPKLCEFLFIFINILFIYTCCCCTKNKKSVHFFFFTYYLFVYALYGASFFLCLPFFYRVLFCNVLHTKGCSQCTRCTAQCENTRRGKYLLVFIFSIFSLLVSYLYCFERIVFTVQVSSYSLRIITICWSACSHINAMNKRWTHTRWRTNGVTVKSIRNILALIWRQVAEQRAHSHHHGGSRLCFRRIIDIAYVSQASLQMNKSLFCFLTNTHSECAQTEPAMVPIEMWKNDDATILIYC